ncbi:HPP family protein [Shewanella amazonensis]|uniref:CBS-domain-containing membrane protein n=1 Tax=Shewanella amazonensis (strain ATCC BAA-1098 / SB2B) TaxID=326297 RepID=A1SAZ2_SHEAM|nr:HPP family protein [Shewanella amazonensis]ABM01549.1 CBS-domain-containing membrane protein [Shewanella amazonensis SB2B]
MKFYLRRMKPKAACPPRPPMKKILWSWLGAFVGIYLVANLGQWMGPVEPGHMFVIGSFGASAVLVYGAPMADFSQPRNLILGNLFSALIGVTVWQLAGDNPVLASALAVSLAIAVMHLTRTMHPPAGAAALIAVIGGDSVQRLGYLYAITPVLLGSLALLLVALVINNLSSNPKRHYPRYWL